MVLCERCAGIDFGLLIERACIEAVEKPANSGFFASFPITKGLSFAALRQAVALGCDLCSLIHQGLLDNASTRSAHEQLTDDTLIDVLIARERCHSKFAPISVQCSGLQVVYSNADMQPDRAWMGLTLESEGVGQHVSGRHFSWNPSLWRSWMNDCIKTHGTCLTIEKDGYAPTRLIDVGSVDTAPRLVESHGKSVEYVALSHCWGGSLPLQTTTANFYDHLDAVPWDALPATFQDAVKVTRSMGYRYLWIDCLCIIQDSEEDWLRECALMGEVYAGAALTLAAERSKSPLDGLFEAPNRSINNTCSIPIRWASTGKPDELVIGLPTTPRVYYSLSFLYGPLSTRGWALQERVLSTRVLYMCGDATCFTCSCSESTDRLPWPMPLFHGHFRMTLPHMLDPVQSLKDWHMLVMDYTARQLTNARDRLPAISGVARIISERYGWEYVAGLWSHDLEGALLWWVLEPATPLSINPTSYSGPSWSWASVDRQICCHLSPMLGKRHPRSWIEDRDKLLRLSGSDWVSHYEVRRFGVELAGEDPFAEVTSGRLTIAGNIRPIPCPTVLDDSWQSQPLLYTSDNTVDVKYRPDQTTIPQTGPETETSAAGTRCLLAGFSRFHTVHNRTLVCYALVVQVVPGSNDTFRRIGMMMFERSEENVERWDEAVDWLLAAERKEIYLI